MGEPRSAGGGVFDGTAGVGEGRRRSHGDVRLQLDELVSSHLVSTRARSMRFQVECVLLLFDEGGLARASPWRAEAESSRRGLFTPAQGAWPAPRFDGARAKRPVGPNGIRAANR
jgi:hypothetical protein